MIVVRIAGALCLAIASHACVERVELPQPSAANRGDVADVRLREVTLTRSACFGTCPVYSVVYRRDGSVEYRGEQHVDHLGLRTGRLSVGDFAELSRFLEQSGFSTLDEWYRVGRTDMPTVTVTATSLDGRSKSVSEYGPSGPPRLWAIHRVIDGLLTEVQWSTTGSEPGTLR